MPPLQCSGSSPERTGGRTLVPVYCGWLGIDQPLSRRAAGDQVVVMVEAQQILGRLSPYRKFRRVSVTWTVRLAEAAYWQSPMARACAGCP